MNITITNRNEGKVSESLHDRIDTWLEASEERYGSITSAQVIIEKSDEASPLVEAKVHVLGKDIFAKADGNNLYSALDKLEQKINRQLDKVHQKQVHKKGIQKPELNLVD